MVLNIIILKHQEYIYLEKALFNWVIAFQFLLFRLLTVEANFGLELHPQDLASSENSDCIDIAHLAYHILSKKGRMQQESQTSRQKMLQMKLNGKEVSVDPGLSSELVDFLKACDKCDMGLLINVS